VIEFSRLCSSLSATSPHSPHGDHRPPKLTPQIRAMSSEYRLIAAYIDAHISKCWAVYASAVVVETKPPKEWKGDRAERELSERWGVVDQHGVYLVAGLTKAETEVAFLHYDRQLDSVEIGQYLKRSALTVRVQLHKARERLRRLAA
jgi:DNA-binding CsgD family transcriptional regulator